MAAEQEREATAVMATPRRSESGSTLTPEQQDNSNKTENAHESVEKKSETGDQAQEEDEKEYPPFKIVLPAMIAIYLAFFLVAIDRTIIGTAIPRISADFNSFDDIAWYEAGFLLPLCIFQLSFGRVYKYYSSKWTLIIMVAIFEIGSIVCAAAPNSASLIVGRVITGIGGTGMSTGSFLLITLLVPLQKRPQYLGFLGAVFGVSSVLGPILGGYLTSITWRWCFWINLPVGGVSLVLLVLLIPNNGSPVKPASTLWGKIDELDPLGFVLIAPAITCLLFAIEWGGSKYAWSSGTIIALFVVGGVLFVAFVVAQVWRGEKATIPPRIIKQRTVLAGTLCTIGIGSCLIIFSFYLPIWFQVIQGKSPENSGLSLIALLLSNVLAVIASGIITSALGYYTPLIIIGSAILIVGAGLLSTWSVDVGAGRWIGYQVITGFGLGMVLQQPNIAVQTVLPDSEVSIGISILSFTLSLGGTIFITIAQTLLENNLVSGLKDVLPNVDASTLGNSGAASLRDVAKDKLGEVLVIYNDSIRAIWYLALGLGGWVFVTSFLFEWRSVKGNKKKVEDTEKEKVEGGEAVVQP